ncbi:MAG: hypothetical protein HYT37_04460 [Candidatus Sungbacteria bacterium]|nr:hypothetical protein [Candidatus Sungbacteria bacterium]
MNINFERIFVLLFGAIFLFSILWNLALLVTGWIYLPHTEEEGLFAANVSMALGMLGVIGMACTFFVSWLIRKIRNR